MQLTNSKDAFGWLSISLHWLLAFALIGMYFLGDYMVELGYYDTWYHRAPQIHKEIGAIIGVLMLLRLLWNLFQTTPDAISNEKPLINKLAKLAHIALYGLVFVLVISGYLISTAKGQGIDIFGWFEIPALLSDNKDRGELAGDIHEWIGLLFIVTVALHALAALVHHFVFKDHTLKRMLGKNEI